jgi:hypothetical protein
MDAQEGDKALIISVDAYHICFLSDALPQYVLDFQYAAKYNLETFMTKIFQGGPTGHGIRAGS